jgi:phenylacetaldehyde dehydrogenase
MTETTLPPSAHFINGEWDFTAATNLYDVRNPADGSTLGTIPCADQTVVDRAVRSANSALSDKKWRDIPPVERGMLLNRLADLITLNSEKLATIESLDNGKPIAFSSTLDIPLCAMWFRYFAGWTSKISGQCLQPGLQATGSFHCYTRKEPVGVVAAIVPWNFPLVLAVWKIAPALAAGCTVVLKPAEDTPYSALMLSKLAIEAGFPPGVLNVVLGKGDTGRLLVEHEGIDKISFTGSTQTGKAILRAAANDLKRITLELGGKSPTIIMPDANMDLAIPGATQAIFVNSGQICFAGSRLIVPRTSMDQIIDGISSVASTLKVGPGLDPETLMGPVVNQKQLHSILEKVDRSIMQGASLAHGGNQIRRNGYFIEPTILVTEDRENTAFREEFFGPVLTVTPYDSLDDIADIANDTEYGLAAHIYTESLNNAHKLAAKVKAGTIWINTQLNPDPNIPFGGFKQSGWGRENGEEVLNSYTETKSVIMHLG